MPSPRKQAFYCPKTTEEIHPCMYLEKGSRGRPRKKRKTLMRKFAIIAVLSLMELALAAVPVLAVNPYFTKASASGTNADGNLVVSFNIAGMGTNETITVTTTGQA